MKIAFYGAAHEVTGSCTVVTALGKKIMIDCGMEQGPDIYENVELPISPSQIDYLLLTHAHIDHSGKIPALTKEGFNGNIYCTTATEKLCNIMLLDSAHIQEFEAQWRNRKAKRAGKELYSPLYTADDVSAALKQFVGCEYEREYSLCEGITVRFTDAGHLLGSACISLTVREKGIEETIVFSGDLGNVNRPLIKDPQTPQKADYVVIESTYGNRIHPERIHYIEQLSKIINETFSKGGNLVIPSFAVGRTQELLYLLRIIKEKGLVSKYPNFPIYVDSPLATEATEIYSGELSDYYDDETLEFLKSGINPIKLPNLRLAVTSDDSMKINRDHTPKIIISASGMCEAGRIRHHLKHNLWSPENTILFVGYQAEGTLGRAIVDGADTVKLFGETVQIKARIEQMQGISGHADQEILLNWLAKFKITPKTVFINHGSDTVCDEFAETIKNRFNTQAIAPYNGAEYDLTDGVCLKEGNKNKIARNTAIQTRRESTAFLGLLKAGKMLMDVIEKYRQGANKDIRKFADQILFLCEKWDK